MHHLIGIAKGRTSDIIFVTTDVGVFMIELKSERATKVYDRDDTSLNIFPYMSFCTPGTILYIFCICGYLVGMETVRTKFANCNSYLGSH